MMRTPRSIASTVLVAAGLGISATAVAGLALSASATPLVGIVLQDGATTSEQQPAASGTNAPGADVHDDEMDRSMDPLVDNPRAVIDTDSERAAFAALQDDCMIEAGFDWWDTARAMSTDNLWDAPWWVEGKSLNEQAEIYQVLYGENTSSTYDWKRAGCHGYALHKTDNDENH